MTQAPTPEDFELPAPDTHCFDDGTGKDCWSYSPEQVRSILQTQQATNPNDTRDAQHTPRALWKSTDDAYGRAIRVTTDSGPCLVCKTSAPCLSVDASDGEYLTFTACGPCLKNLLEKS